MSSFESTPLVIPMVRMSMPLPPLYAVNAAAIALALFRDGPFVTIRATLGTDALSEGIGDDVSNFIA